MFGWIVRFFGKSGVYINELAVILSRPKKYPSMKKAFLIIFHGQIENGRIIDIGDDPCFDSIPSWGICRPTTRRAVKKGDTLIFISKVDNNYLLKGWFDVGEKLDYISALQRFPNRQNVIITTIPSTHQIKWRYKKLQKSYRKRHDQALPEFLFYFDSDNVRYYHSQTDDHEIDNWKCRRIFLCKSKQFERCIEENSCLIKDTSIRLVCYENYIVADLNKWEDLDYLKITIEEIKKATNFETPIKTPKGQHNVLRFDKYSDDFFRLIELKKKQIAQTTNNDA